jgi:cell division protein FtsW (lipid II flippase)
LRKSPRAPEQQHDAQSAPRAVPNGPAAAAILAASVGCCALGVLAVVADGSKTLARWLAFYAPSGPLSGVTSVAILLWLASWFVLSRRWRQGNANLLRANALAFFLLAIALLLTFPPFADLLLRK